MKGSQLQVITDPLEGDELVLIVKNRTNRITPISNLLAAATFEDGEPNQFLAWDQTWKEVQFGYLSDVSPYTITEANKYIRVNSDATGLEYASIDLSGYVTKTLDETITGLKTFTNNNGLLIKNPSSTVKALKLGVTSGTSEFVGEIRYDIIGANRIWLLPDKTGTILVDSDLSAYVPKAGATTITGNKYFINNSGTWFSSADESGQLFTGNPIKIQGNTATSPYIGFQGTITSQNLEADRIWYLPNKNGVLATVDDIPADRFYTYTRGVGSYATLEHNRADKSMVLSALSTNHTAVGVSSLLHLLSYGQDQGRAIYVDHNNYGIFSVSWSGGTVVRYRLSLYPNYIGQDTFFDIASPSQTHNIQLRVSEVTGDPITTQYYLPKDGTSGQILSTNGSGVLSWITPSGGSTIPVFSVGTDGLVPGPASSANNIFLASNGTWQTVNAGITTSLQLGDSGTARTGVIKLVADSYMYLSESYVGGETTFTIQHGATSPASSITVSGIERVSAITIDARGHVTALTKNNFPTFSSSSAGLAPSPGSPSGRYLRDDGWAVLPTGTSHDPVSLTGENYITLSGQILTLNKIGVSQINASGIADNKFLKGNGTWDVPSGGGDYILPLAANGTRGGLQIGYTANGANLPLLLSSEKGYITLTKSAIEAALTGNITSHTHSYDNYGFWLAAVTGTSGTASITSGSILTFTGAGATTITRVGNTITISSSSGGGGIADIPSGVNKKYLRSRDSLDNAIWEEFLYSPGDGDGYIDGASFSSGTLSLTENGIVKASVSLDGRYLKIDDYYDKYPTSVSVTGTTNKYITITLNDSTSIQSLPFTDLNNYVDGISGSGNGTLTLTRAGLSNLTVDLTHSHNYVTSFNTRTGSIVLTKADIEAALTGIITSHEHNYTNNVGTVTSVGAGLGLYLTGVSTVNPTLNIQSHSGTSGSIGTIVVTEDHVGVALGNTSITAAPGNHNHDDVYLTKHYINDNDAHFANNSKVFYSNNSGLVTELSLGANDTIFTSSGTANNPTFKSFYSFDAYDGTKKALVPIASPLEGASSETRFLRADGVWIAPSGTGGGMSNPMTAVGDIIIGSTGGTPIRLAASTNGYVLTLASGSPIWAAPGAYTHGNHTGEVTSVNMVTTLHSSAITNRDVYVPTVGNISVLNATDNFLIYNGTSLYKNTALDIKKYVLNYMGNTTSTVKILTSASSNVSWFNYSFIGIPNGVSSAGTTNQLLKWYDSGGGVMALTSYTPGTLSSGSGITTFTYNGFSAASISIDTNVVSTVGHKHILGDLLLNVGEVSRIIGSSQSSNNVTALQLISNTPDVSSNALYIENSYIGAKLEKEATPKLNAHLNVNGKNLTNTGNVYTNINNSFDLGSSSYRYKDLHIYSVKLPNWSMETSGNNLVFKYGGNIKATFQSDGKILAVDNIIAFA